MLQWIFIESLNLLNFDIPLCVFLDFLKQMPLVVNNLFNHGIIWSYRNPVPEGSTFPAWPPTNSSRSPYMKLGETIELRGSLLEQRTLFWDSIYERYYRYPEPPGEIKNSPGSACTISGSFICFVLIVFKLILLWIILNKIWCVYSNTSTFCIGPAFL